MKYNKTFIIFILSFIFLNLTLVLATNINDNNYKNFFRVHVVANSDSIDDQLLKYTVAKQVNEYIIQITRNSQSKEESKKIIQQNINDILTITNNIIQNNNLNYSVKVYIGKIQYEEKTKDNIQMNKGTYDSLKIVIGNGNGQNWWSLIYPTTITDTNTQDVFEESNITFSFGIIDIVRDWFNI